VLEALTDACYYLNVEKTRYKFSLKENLNKRFADRRATVQGPQIDEEVKREIQRIFAPKELIERAFFTEKSIQVPDRPVVTVLISDLTRTMEDEKATKAFADQIVRESGTSARTFKSALIWVVPESAQPMREEARKLLAWQTISDEAEDLKLDEAQKRQLQESIHKARRDLKESIWRSYKNVLLLGKDNTLKRVDLGLVHSSSVTDSNPLTNVFNRLSTDGDVEKLGVSPNFLVRNWAGAFKEWPTKSIRDAFYASPVFPRLLNAETIKETIARGVEGGLLAYVGKTASGKYQPFAFGQSISASEIEFSDDMFVITAETAKAYLETQKASAPATAPGGQPSFPLTTPSGTPAGSSPTSGGGQLGFPQPPATPAKASKITWHGDVPPQRWMNFYTKVLSRFAATPGLKLTVQVEVTPTEGVSKQTVEDTQNALRELGLSDNVESK